MNAENNYIQLSKELVINNINGLHARPSALFVKVASKFRANVLVEKNGEQVNGKSIMGLMMLAASKGSVIKIITEGEDANALLDALEELVCNNFGEKQ